MRDCSSTRSGSSIHRLSALLNGSCMNGQMTKQAASKLATPATKEALQARAYTQQTGRTDNTMPYLTLTMSAPVVSLPEIWQLLELR